MRLDNNKGAIPLYLQISEILREQIESNKYKNGDIIPSENELCLKYGVSRITIRQAIAELEKEGYLKRERGIGTTVTYTAKFNEFQTEIKSFTNEMKERGITPTTKEISISKVLANSEVASIFNIKENSEVFFLHRVRCADEKPIVVFDTYFSCYYNFPLDEKEYSESMYDVFEKVGMKKPVKVQETFSADLASSEIAKKLDINEGDPIFKRKRISYSRKNEIIEYTVGYYRGDSYTYSIEYDNK